MSRALAIDLGTTKACMAVTDADRAEILPNLDGSRVTPSVVACSSRGKWLVGHDAKRQAPLNPKRTVFSFQRLAGWRFDSPEVQSLLPTLPYDVVEAPNGDSHIRIDARAYSPVELAGTLLSSLKTAARENTGDDVSEAVIAVAPTYNRAQRQAVLDAAAIADIRVRRIVSAADAAALMHSTRDPHAGIVAVLDAGGGTFSVSLYEIRDGICSALASVGDPTLGGRSFDQRIVDWLIADVARKASVELERHPEVLQRLHEAAEMAKCQLSVVEQAEIVIPFLAMGKKGPLDLRTILTRPRFERLIAPLLKRMEPLCHRAIEDAGVHRNDLDAVLLVGGQSRSPAVSRLAGRVLGKRPMRRLHPDEAVAGGAALQLGILQGKLTDRIVLQKTLHTLGLETSGGGIIPVIPRNSSMPTKVSQVLTNRLIEEGVIKLGVVEAEEASYDGRFYFKSPMHRTTLLGTLALDVDSSTQDNPHVEVTFELDINGCLTVSVSDLQAGRTKRLVMPAIRGRATETATTRDPDRSVSQRRSGKGDTLTELRDFIHETFMTVADRLTRPEVREVVRALDQADDIEPGASAAELERASRRLLKAASLLGTVILRQ